MHVSKSKECHVTAFAQRSQNFPVFSDVTRAL